MTHLSCTQRANHREITEILSRKGIQTEVTRYVNGLIVLSGSGSVTLQVPPDFFRLPALIHDCSLDLLSGHDCEGHRCGEGGEAEGDSEDDGPEKCHLLAELGSVQCAAVGPQLCPPCPYPEGDFQMIYR